MQSKSATVIVMHFGELWLRGRNRNYYISRLMKNITERLQGENLTISRQYDRVLLNLEKRSDLDSIKRKAATIFGVSRFEITQVTKPDLKSIKGLCTKALSNLKKSSVVRIQSHRSYKQLPFNSIDVVRELSKIAKKKGLGIANKGFDFELNINITKDSAFVDTGRIKGAGGLPVGTSGRAVVLLSGGIDSPVAAWYAMKRGLEPIYVHFHGFPNNDAVELKKIRDIVSKLREYCPRYRLYLLPTSAFQLAVLGSGRSETVLLKYFMLSAADKIAEKENASLIYTGDCLGQVSSQTPQNLLAESQGVVHEIMRPLIGFDKEEIIGRARLIGTYELSILPYMDVCSINARNPSTGVRPDKVRQLARRHRLKGIATKTIRLASVTQG